MTQANRKPNFLNEFQKKLKQGRWLLEENSHHWATRLFLDLFFETESELKLSRKRKQFLILKLSQTWKDYIGSLSASQNYDFIKLIDAYNRFLSFLLNVKDYTLFKEYTNRMLKKILSRSTFSIPGIIKFINSVSPIFIEQGDWIQVVELQILAIFLAKDFAKVKHFKSSKEYLEKIIRKIKPSDRKLFFYSLLENIHREFNISGEPNEFNTALTKKLIKKDIKLLEEDIKSLKDIKVNKETYESINNQLITLYIYLMQIGEYKWGMIIAKTLFNNVKKYRTLEEATTHLYESIDQFTDRCLFDGIYEFFIFLEDHMKEHYDLRYNHNLIEMWAKACDIFATKEEKRLLFLAFEKLTKYLIYPNNTFQIIHYFHTYNYLWQFKSQYLSQKKDFWKMLFYRALFQSNDIPLAKKILPLLESQLQSQVKNFESLLEEKAKIDEDIYQLPQSDEIPDDFKDLKVANMIIKINSEGEFSYRVHYSNQNIYEKTLKKEHWNSTYLITLYKDLFSPPSDREYNFNLKEFGKILFLSLPKPIRDYFSQFTEQILKPQISFVFDKVKIPFELIYGKEGFAFLNYSLGYSCNPPSIMGSRFLIEESSSTQENMELNALLIDSINALAPKKWNEEKKKKEALYRFSSGPNQLLFAKKFFDNREGFNEFTALTGSESKKETIIREVSKGNNHIIHIVGNLIFLESHPEYSYFITNDEKILSITEFISVLEKRVGNIRPLIFLDIKLFDNHGTPINNPLQHISKVMRKLNFNNIKGILTRINPEFNKETKQIISEFFINLLKANNMGISLFKARKTSITDTFPKLIKQEDNALKKSRMGNDKESEVIIKDIQPSLSFLLFGEPWKKL